MTKVLLTGASGTVGKEVLLQLGEFSDEIEITVFDKKLAGSGNFYKKPGRNFNLILRDNRNH